MCAQYISLRSNNGVILRARGIKNASKPACLLNQCSHKLFNEFCKPTICVLQICCNQVVQSPRNHAQLDALPPNRKYLSHSSLQYASLPTSVMRSQEKVETKTTVSGGYVECRLHYGRALDGQTSLPRNRP